MTDVFNSATTENVTTEPTQNETPSSYVEQLVGEGKKFKDAEALAKGKLEADKHIEEITRTLNELREEVKKQQYTKELLDTLQRKGTESGTAETGEPTQTRNSATENTTQTSEVDIETLVEQAITKKEQARTVEQNVATANTAMVAQYGEKAGEVVQSKARELGISVDRLKEIAAESPTAFLQLVGAKTEKAPASQVAPPGSIRQDSLNTNTSDRTFDYYQKMRKENKNLYYSPKVQRMLMEDRMRLGEKFYNK